MWIKSCFLLANALSYLGLNTGQAKGFVFCLAIAMLGFFSGKRSGILVYHKSGKGNTFCHVTSKIEVDVVTSRGQ